MGNGYLFYNRIDAEVITKLADYYFKKCKIGLGDEFDYMTVRFKGRDALVMMFKDYQGEIFVLHKDKPMIIGAGSLVLFRFSF